MPNDDRVKAEVSIGSWRFNFQDSINEIEVENCTRPYERVRVRCTIPMRAADLEMFARGWVACRDHVS